MADVIILSDDDFSPAKPTSISKRPKDNAAKQWNDIFSQKSHRDRRNPGSESHRSSHRSSDHSSKRSSERSSERSSKHSSHRPSERRSHRHSSSRDDRERHRSSQRAASDKSIIELDVSDDDTKSSAIHSSKKTSQEKSSGKSSRESPNHRHSRKSSHNHHTEKSSKHHHSRSSSNHHSNKSSPDKSSKSTSGVPSTKSTSNRTSSAKGAREKDDAATSGAGPGVTANGRRSGSRRSLAAELGVSKSECRGSEDDPSPRHDQLIANGKPSELIAEPMGDSRTKRPARGDEEAVPAVKRARLTRVEVEAVSDTSSAVAQEPKPEPSPCQQSLEEVCTLLRPLLSGPELKLEAKVRRRHAAVVALAGGRSGRVQHLIGATQQCAERLRAEPERCFTVLRGFLEQLDQIKIVASSAQSRTGPAPPAAAADKGKTAGANKAKAGSGVGVAKADAGATVAVVKKTAAAVADAARASPSMKVNGSASAAPKSEQEEKDARRHRRHVAKLEKTLRRLEREIVRQDEQEVDWDDFAGSAYIVGARLKRRYVQVYRFYCKLVGAVEEAERLDSRRIRFDGTRYPEINRRIEKFVNQTREFPDFKDVMSLIETANVRGRLKLGPTALHDQAKEAFLQLGALLQKRRRAALVESMDSLAGAEEWRGRDPAAGDPTLGGRLAENAASGKEKLNQVFREFVQRQETAAAERRQKRADAAEGSDDEEEEEEDEDETEAEESEVTDEELEPEKPKPASEDLPDSNGSDQDGALSDVEARETDKDVVKEEGDPSRKGDQEKEPEGTSDAKMEEGVDDGRTVAQSIGSGPEGGPEDSSGAGQVSKDSTHLGVKDDRDSSAEGRKSNVSEAKPASKTDEDDSDLRDEPEHVDENVEETKQGYDVPNKSPNIVNSGAKQRTENDGLTEAENKSSDHGECEKSRKPASAE